MIFFRDKTGQTANNLFEFATFLAISMERKEWLINLTFSNNKGYFQGTSRFLDFDYKSVTGSSNSKVNKAFLYAIDFFLKSSRIQLLKGEGGHVELDLNQLRGRGVVKEGGWFVNFDLFYKYETQIREYFKPVKAIESNIDSFMALHRPEGGKLIGVHIRKGDYIDFLGGEFYFENQVYFDKMLQMKYLFPDQPLRFMIASNESVDLKDFEGLDVIKAPGHFIEDLYALAGCDFILGPPSTFTMWASFFGKVPLRKIRNKNDKIALDQFELDYGY